MARRLFGKGSDNSAAVAPLVGMSLFVLVGAGGLAFDYARMAALDTELQNAADQAALAAATQLDGAANARARASAAAQTLLSNNTLFAANAGSDTNAPRKVVIATPDYYQSFDSATDTFGTGATTDINAKVVRVTVEARRADFALTPVVASLRSATISAQAVASLGAGAICKVPPLMLCNPNEGNGGTFPASSDLGRGLLLVPGGGNGTWGPGNYGYLDFGNGANALERAIGANVDVEPCVDASTVQTKPGNTASTPAAINTRFDIFQNGLIGFCDASTGNCSPAGVTIKDVVHYPFSTNDNCGFQTGSDPWRLPAAEYLPDPTTRTSATPTNMGLPRDVCHSVNATGGDCVQGLNTQSKFGDGNWARSQYFSINHTAADLATAATWAGKVSTATTGQTALSRYDVYRWELSKLAANTLTLSRDIGDMRRTNPQGSEVGQPTPHSAYATARCATPRLGSTTVKDRRLLTAAVVNCTAGNVQGSANVRPAGWVDLFLTEPSLDRARTNKDQIYVEVVGVSTRPNGESTFQYYLRQRPRLLT